MREISKKRIGVLLSGGGTNLQALINACRDGNFPARIAVVISNHPKAYGLKRAQQNNLPTVVVEQNHYLNREHFDQALREVLDHAGVDLICLAGFMRILSSSFVQHYQGRLLNIHPSLLPAFPGLNVHQKALDAGVRFSGATVHFVDEGVDTGPIVIQAVVPVLQDDNAEHLAKRILKQEHRIYPMAVRLFAEDRLRISGKQVTILPSSETPETIPNAIPDTALTNPLCSPIS